MGTEYPCSSLIVVPVLGDVLDGRVRVVDVPRGRGDEDAGEPAGAGGVDLPVDRAGLVGQEGHHRRDQVRRHGRRRVARPVSAAWPAMRVKAAGAMRLTLMPWAALVVARLRVSPMTPPLAVA